jgi:hypothetical protein
LLKKLFDKCLVFANFILGSFIFAAIVLPSNIAMVILVLNGLPSGLPDSLVNSQTDSFPELLLSFKNLFFIDCAKFLDFLSELRVTS